MARKRMTRRLTAADIDAFRRRVFATDDNELAKWSEELTADERLLLASELSTLANGMAKKIARDGHLSLQYRQFVAKQLLRAGKNISIVGYTEKEMSDQIEKAGKLSQVDPTLAKHITYSGLDDGDINDDKVKVTKATFSAADLKPSQTTIKLWGVVGIALQMLKTGKIGGYLGALISSDGYIMDGHHRWAAAILAGGSGAKVGGYMAKREKGKELIKVLNILTKGKFRRNKGNSGTGNLADIKPNGVRVLLEDYVANGISGEYPVSKWSVRDTLELNFGSIEEGIEVMAKNATKIVKSTPGWAPTRSDMPVIEPNEAPSAAKVLNEGMVNWKEPF